MDVSAAAAGWSDCSEETSSSVGRGGVLMLLMCPSVCTARRTCLHAMRPLTRLMSAFLSCSSFVVCSSSTVCCTDEDEDEEDEERGGDVLWFCERWSVFIREEREEVLEADVDAEENERREHEKGAEER